MLSKSKPGNLHAIHLHEVKFRSDSNGSDWKLHFNHPQRYMKHPYQILTSILHHDMVKPDSASSERELAVGWKEIL